MIRVESTMTPQYDTIWHEAPRRGSDTKTARRRRRKTSGARQRSSGEEMRVTRLGDLERSEKGGEKGILSDSGGNSSYYIGLYRATGYRGGSLVIKSGDLESRWTDTSEGRNCEH